MVLSFLGVAAHVDGMQAAVLKHQIGQLPLRNVTLSLDLRDRARIPQPPEAMVRVRVVS
jgi:hypothetical protein|eukprot:SAG25_NODE_243_length_11142_cov_106.401069_4_plen_59_part_00